MRRRWFMEAVVCALCALAVVALHLWMTRPNAQPQVRRGSDCLDRIIDDVTLDMQSIESALQSLGRAGGVEFQPQFRPSDQQTIPPIGSSSPLLSKLPLRQVTVRRALQLVLRHYGAENDVEYNVEGDRVSVRISQQSRITCVYDLRDLIPPDATATPSPTKVVGSFSSPVRRALRGGGNIAEGLASSDAALVLCDMILYPAHGGEIWGSEFDGRLILTATPSQHAKVRRMIDIFRMVR